MSIPEYDIWHSMIGRCESPNVKQFPNYGGRGIRVCAEWRTSFDAFIRDVGPRPTPEHSLDRIDNDGHYEPGNVRWATADEQAVNRRNNRMITFDGKTMAVRDWARHLGLRPTVLYSRLHQGWSEVETLAIPYGGRRKANEITRGESHYTTHLKDDQIQEIRQRVQSGERLQAVADDFHVSKTTIHRIATRETWKHVA